MLPRSERSSRTSVGTIEPTRALAAETLALERTHPLGAQYMLAPQTKFLSGSSLQAQAEMLCSR